MKHLSNPVGTYAYGYRSEHLFTCEPSLKYVLKLPCNPCRCAVESGIAAKLLDVMNRGAWPPSLRDMAGGCLEFLAERHSNLR